MVGSLDGRQMSKERKSHPWFMFIAAAIWFVISFAAASVAGGFGVLEEPYVVNFWVVLVFFGGIPLCIFFHIIQRHYKD